ncbi:hypothetical protein GCM10009119_29230 [Algoriphagus jejuensis]|uniref:histidine kinase n=1 Tax=Algoriphagus jejuensis TaxID=419934 RepID=A0ABP3YH73_9BACT
MSQYQQFDISDFLNEIKEPILLMDAEEIVFFNHYFREIFQSPADDWKVFFDDPKLILEADAFFQTGNLPSSKFSKTQYLADGSAIDFEWTFINLPSTYTSRFLVAKGTQLRERSPLSIPTGLPPSLDSMTDEAFFKQSVLDSSGGRLATLDENGNVKFINESVTKKLGYSSEDILGKNYRKISALGKIKIVQGTIEEVFRSKKQVAIDFWVKSKAGGWIYMECFAKNLLQDPQINGVIFSSRDVSEFAQAEKLLQRRYEIENLIIQISSSLINGSFQELENLYFSAISKFGEFLHAIHSEILVFNRESEQLEVLTSWSTGRKEHARLTLPKDELDLIFENLRFLKKGKVMLVSAEIPNRQTDEGREKSRIFVPMISGNKLLGMVRFQSDIPGFLFEKKEIQVLRQFGDVLAAAFLGSQMTQKLERNENLLAHTEMLSKSGSWRFSIQKKRFQFSGGLAVLFDLGAEPISRDFRVLIYKIDKPFRAKFIKDLRKAINELARTSGEFTSTNQEGTVRFFSYEIEGRREFLTQVSEVYGFCTDISHKRASDSYLRLQSQILAQVNDPILVTNLKFEVIYQNEASVQLCCENISRDFEGNLGDLLAVVWEKNEDLIKITSNLKVGEEWKSERHVKTRMKDASPYEISIQAIHAEGTEKVGYSFILRGLEEKYKSEEIAKSAKLIVESSPAVLFRVDPNDKFKINYISENINRFGYDAADLMERQVSFFELLHPTDAQMIQNNAATSRIAAGVPAFSGEYRIRSASGEYFWVEDRTQDVLADTGRILLHEGLFQDISDRKNLESIQSQRDRQYRVLAANIPDTNIFLIDTARIYTLAEGTNFAKWGLSREDFEGKSLKDLQLTPFEQINEIISRVFDSREIIETVFKLNGRHYHQSIRPIVIEDEVVYALSIVKDVQDEYQAKLDLQQSEEKYRRLVEESTEIIFSLTEAFILNYVSPNIVQFLGYNSEDVIGRSIFEFLHPDDLGVFKVLVDETSDFLAQHQFLEYRLKHMNGMYRVFNSNGKLIEDKEGIHRYYTGIARDISTLKETQRELVLAKERAEQASQIKSQFLSVMSHEIRTPMNAVIGLAHLLMEEEPRPDQLENLKTLQFSAENLMALINDILDFNKIDSGKVELEEAPFDLRNVIHRIVHSHSYQAHEKSLKITCEIDEAIPATLIGDSLRMGQIVNNLVSNAIKFTEKGFVKITISREYTQGNQTDIRFVFEDSGIGIPESKRKTVFEAFTQASSSTSRKYGGTGLGLAIVKRLVELFGGEIEVAARKNGGSIFEFTVPFEFVDLQKIETEKAIHISNQNFLKNASVLVAEDNVVNQILIRKFLTKWNVGNLVIASDGRDALEKFKAGDFDLILLDLQMPELDGFAVSRTIRGLEDVEKQKIPILALTAASIHEVKEEMRISGMDDFVPKPFTPEILFEKILKHLNPKDQNRNGV